MAEFVCNNCGARYKKWVGKCLTCAQWGTVEEELISADSYAPLSKKGDGDRYDLPKVEIATLESQNVTSVTRLKTDLRELDGVLGGGFVLDGILLIGGEPGIGKSTLLLQIAGIVSQKGHKVLYVSGEESIAQISMRAKRLSINDKNISICATGSVLSFLKEIDKNPPQFLIVDSIQTMFVSYAESSPGTVTQVRAATFELIKFCKSRHVILIIVGHITKDGALAGPKILEHMVDTVIYFENNETHQFRILRAVKNRFGPSNEIGIFAMGGNGLEMVNNTSEAFLSQRSSREHGVAAFVAIEGTRPVVTEIESLVLQSYLPSPRRNVVGWDVSRLAMMLAILQSTCKIKLHDRDIYLSMSGGFRTLEPAADLAVVVSLLISRMSISLAADYIVLGEVALSGQVRRVSWLERRMQEGIKLGYKRFIIPRMDVSSEWSRKPNLVIHYVDHLKDLMAIKELQQQQA